MYIVLIVGFSETMLLLSFIEHSKCLASLEALCIDNLICNFEELEG